MAPAVAGAVQGAAVDPEVVAGTIAAALGAVEAIGPISGVATVVAAGSVPTVETGAGSVREATGRAVVAAEAGAGGKSQRGPRRRGCKWRSDHLPPQQAAWLQGLFFQSHHRLQQCPSRHLP